jgi:hypothetical protein
MYELCFQLSKGRECCPGKGSYDDYMLTLHRKPLVSRRILNKGY